MQFRAWTLAGVCALAMRVAAAPSTTSNDAGGRASPPVSRAAAAKADASGLPAGIERWSLRELAIAEARPLAERGAVFRTAWLDRYFRGQAWYRPSGFDPRGLSSGERERVAALARYRAGLSPAALAKKQEELLQRKRSRRVHCPLAVAVAGDAAAARVAVLKHGGLELWDVAAGTSRAVPPAPRGGAFWAPQVAVTTDGTRVFSVEDVNQSPQVSSWEWSSLRRLPPFRWADTSARYSVPSDAYVLLPGGRAVLAWDSGRREWRVIQLDEPKRQLVLPAHSLLTGMTRVAEARAGVLGVASGRAWFWPGPGRKRADGAVELGKPLELARANDADVSSDGRSFAVVDDSAHPYIANVNAPKQATWLASSIRGTFGFVAFSPSGDKLLAGTRELGVGVWQVPSGKLLYERRERAVSLECAGQWAAFLADGRHVALAGESGGLELVDLQSGRSHVVAAEPPTASLEDERIEAALLSRATGARGGETELRELSFEEQPLLLEQPLTEEELLQSARAGTELRSLEALIQARRGRGFRSPRWKAYAENLRWYRADPGYTEARLTQLDRENLSLVKRVRQKLDPRPAPPAPDVVASAPRGAFPGCPTGTTRVERSEGDRVSAACVAKHRGKEVLEGPDWTWLPTGRLGEVHAWLDGQRQGPAMSWYFTGVRHTAGAYARGARDGAWLTYHRNGLIALRADYRQGVPDGPWTTYYDNGRPAVALTFRAGAPDPSAPVERFTPEGSRWPADAKLTCGDGGCATPVARLDFDTLPPLRAEACSHAAAEFDRPLPRAAWAPILAGARKAWPPDAGGGAIPGPGACVDSVRLACARDLDADSRTEVLAELSYRIAFGLQRGCEAKPDAEAWTMSAVVALSPPASGTRDWTPRGVMAYPTCNADVCPGHDTLRGFVLLPSGETALHVAVLSGGGDCATSEHEEIRTRKDGVWKAVASRTVRACDGTREPEENDVY